MYDVHGQKLPSNSDPRDLPDAYIIIAPVIEARRFRVRVPSHALRDLDPPSVRQIIRNPRGAEGVAAYRGFNARIGSTATHHAPHIPRSIGLAESCAVLPIAERNSGPLRSPTMPAVFM